jgi:NCAIR mutase (PurE)-related protein
MATAPLNVRALLEQVRQGSLSPEAAEAALGAGRVAELDFATLDVERSARTGFPEVVYGEGKTAEQIVAIFRKLEAYPAPVLATRLSEAKAEALTLAFPRGEWRSTARAFALRREMPALGPIAVVTAGTSDQPVAEEAAFTAEVLGCTVVRIVDVGVAGVHRLLRRREEIAQTKAAVVVAGMEGALPTAVAGLVGIPVVAVPTSIGYGANLGGIAALLGMLNSCAPNVAVVNIDNGFGAGFYAALIARGAK